MAQNYIQLNRSEKTNWLIEHFPNAFLLLTIIAQQARRYPDKNDGLEIGDAIIGELQTSRKAGLTRKSYRGAIDKLIEHGFIEVVYNPKSKTQKRAIKRAIKSKVVCLINSEVYDINPQEEGDQKGEPRAIKGRQTKNDKNEEEHSYHSYKEMKGIEKKKKIISISFPDLRNQEEFETLLIYAKDRAIDLNPDSVARWIKSYGIPMITETLGDFLNKADKEKYKDKHEAWIESALKGKWNVLKNKEFIVNFCREKCWNSMTITKNYCRDEETGNDYKFDLKHEMFVNAIEDKYNQKQGVL